MISASAPGNAAVLQILLMNHFVTGLKRDFVQHAILLPS
jgi:hypothetical protein